MATVQTFLCTICHKRHTAVYGFGLKHTHVGWYGKCLRCFEGRPGDKVLCQCEVVS